MKIIKKSLKKTEIYQKDITIRLTGSNKDDLQQVAHAIHSINHPLVTKGLRRKVQMVHTSTEPIKIFAGSIKCY